MKPRAIGLASITADLKEADKLHDRLVEVVQSIPHEKFGYFSVYSTEADDLEIVSEGPEDPIAVERVRDALFRSNLEPAEINIVMADMKKNGVIFRLAEQ